MKTIITILMILISSHVYAGVNVTPDFTKTINAFLCSDDITEMIKLVGYPVFIEHRQSTYNEKELIKGIKTAQKETGLYKLGKVCKGFTIEISGLEQYSKGYSVNAISSDNKLRTKIYLNEKGKIVGIFSN